MYVQKIFEKKTGKTVLYFATGHTHIRSHYILRFVQLIRLSSK